MGCLKKFVLSVFFCLFVATPVMYSQTPQKHWQEVKTVGPNFKAITAQPDIEVFSAPNIVMLKVNHNVEVRIFTILGKLISSQNLEPGVYEYKLDAHGIYIIKTEDTSCKIAL